AKPVGIRHLAEQYEAHIPELRRQWHGIARAVDERDGRALALHRMDVEQGIGGVDHGEKLPRPADFVLLARGVVALGPPDAVHVDIDEAVFIRAGRVEPLIGFRIAEYQGETPPLGPYLFL